MTAIAPLLPFGLPLLPSAPSLMPQASEKAVRQSGTSNDSDFRSDGTVVHERVIAFLRARHPVWTAKGVAQRTGISPATVTKWLDRGSAPSGGHLWRLGVVYGVAFVAAVYVEVSAVEEAAKAERVTALEAELAALRAGDAR